jgi:hypothetical protein
LTVNNNNLTIFFIQKKYHEVFSYETGDRNLTYNVSSDSNSKKNYLDSQYNRLREYIFLNKENNPQQQRANSSKTKSSEKSCLLEDYDNNSDYAICEPNTTVHNENKKKSNFSYNKLNEAFTTRKQSQPTNPSAPLYTSIFNRLTSKRKIDLEKQQQKQDQQVLDKKMKKFTCLTEIKPDSLFANHADGLIWYFNLLCDTMLFNIRDCKHLSSVESKERLHVANAHLLYVKNLYEVRIALSKHLKNLVSDVHPCIVALSLLLDSGAVRICESHSCVCDNYIYLFSTKIKFCSWKAKYYLILKKPKQSSIDRLNLIEKLINCQKLVQDKSIL